MLRHEFPVELSHTIISFKVPLLSLVRAVNKHLQLPNASDPAHPDHSKDAPALIEVRRDRLHARRQRPWPARLPTPSLCSSDCLAASSGASVPAPRRHSTAA